jgi:hypothetical protein
MGNLRVKIGAVLMRVSPGLSCSEVRVEDPHRRFLVHGGDADFGLTVHLGGPDTPSGDLVFQSGGPWSLYDNGAHYTIALRTPPSNSRPYRLAVINRDFTEGDLYIHGPDPTDPAPFHYPLDELIMVQLLSRGRGAILHACGVVDEGRGLLFCGVSGAGKSTMANIWKPTHATLLSDDRIIVRRMDGVFRMYGTPWHGDANVCDPGNAPLEKVFFIVHADRNYAKPISPIDAASRLLVRCFPPFYFKEGMEFVTNFLAEVAEEVPCYELGFVPDQSVVEFVRSME